MGFTTGFLSGITLTTTTLYLSLTLHRANRAHQRALLSQQTHLLTSHYEDPNTSSSTITMPGGFSSYASDGTTYVLRKPSVTEMLKDRWNREIEETVRGVQNVDWNKARDAWEDRAKGLWRRVVG